MNSLKYVRTAVLIGFVFYTSFIYAFFFFYLTDLYKIFLLIIFSVISIVIFILFKYNNSIDIKGDKKSFKLLNGIILGIILYIILSHLFGFFHEINHSWTLLFYKVPIYEIGTFLELGLAYTSHPEITSPIIGTWLYISGSLGEIVIWLVLLLIVISFRKKLKSEIYVTVYIVIVIGIYDEINYWRKSITNQFGDAWQFLSFNPSINQQIMLLVLNGIIWMELIIPTFFLCYDLYIRFLKETLKSKRLSSL